MCEREGKISTYFHPLNCDVLTLGKIAIKWQFEIWHLRSAMTTNLKSFIIGNVQ
jgi:hypothetical protein